MPDLKPILDFAQQWIPPWLPIVLVVHVSVMGAVAYLILLERKVASWVQDRLGPNRVGLGFGIIPGLKDFHFWGLGQPLADGIKFLLKEDYRAKNVDKVLFTLAPAVMVIVIIVSIAVIPWGGIKGSRERVDITAAAAGVHDPQRMRAIADAAALDALPPHHQIFGDVQVVDTGNAVFAEFVQGWHFQIANLNIGVLFVLAALSLAVYGVVIGGWASNNKYSFLGGLRATASMVSYEIPLGLTVLAIVVLFGTLDLGQIVDRQTGYWFGVLPAWNVFVHPLAFLMFLVCIHAEANRAPFDIAEAEQELVGGYHTEYSSMRFAMFFLAEYAGMITTACVCVALFFGGWHLPGLGGSVDPANPSITDSLILCVVRAGVFFGKAVLILFLFMWVRWSLPRFRFDQLMDIAWRALIPISLAILLASAGVVYVTEGATFDGLDARTAMAMLGLNAALLVVFFAASRVLPAPPPTNRRVRVEGSRFHATPLPAKGLG